MNFIKSLAGLACLMACQTGVAGTMGPDMQSNNALMIGIDALYLQTNLPVFNHPVAIESYTPYLAPYVALPSEWGFGFNLQGAYRFNGVNDVQLNWLHLKNTHAFNYNQDVNGGGVFNGRGHLEPSFNVANLELGQRLDYGPMSVRFEGGLQYARLYAERTLNGVFLYLSSIYPIVSDSNSLFQGAGPRGGVDLAYHWSNGLGVTARGDLGFLVGNKKFSQTPNLYGRQTYQGSYYSIVPELEMKVGGEYVYPMAYGDLSMDLGWMWMNYFNAQAYRDVFNSAVSDTHEANVGLQGLYFGMKWLGNLA